jgi:hypothetical protein
MRTLFFVICLLATIACNFAQAEESETAGVQTSPTTVTCQKGNLTRILETTYAGEPGEPPCEVHYKKTVEQPGQDQILWDAKHAKGYCEIKQQEFVEKLKGMGWDCQ